jgi:FtsP/CotA-like multicopper oxidase with cupredoxin domain
VAHDQCLVLMRRAQINVKNEIEDEGTAIHWHGILQKGTPYMDGVPGFGQCPIAPGSSFTYRFQADLYGTSWYHSHWSSQYGSGLIGPMIIYGPNQTNCDEDLGPIMVGDWYHDYYTTVLDALFQPLPAVNIPASDNNLINGKNSFDCSNTNKTCTPNAPLANFNFTSGKTYRLRLINPSAAAVQKITIDNHKFTVIANDFVEIEPYETDVITLAVGQRSDVLVKATGNPTDAVWLRGYKPPPCWPTKGGDEVKAAIFYEKADQTKPPTTQPGPNAYSQDCANDPLTQTVPIMKLPAGDPTSSEVMPLQFRSNGTNLLWFMANRTMRVNYNDPILLEAKLGNFDFPYIENVHNYGTNKSLRFIVENPTQQPHPMHVHGHNMFVLAEGFCNYSQPTGPPGGPPGAPANETGGAGAASKRELEIDYNLAKRQSDNETESPYGKCWDGSITNEANPARRDVHMLPAYSYVVLQWNQDNPGVWPFHCHIVRALPEYDLRRRC